MSARANPPPDAAWQAVKDTPHLTYRQWDYWVNRGWVMVGTEHDEAGTGHWRTITNHEATVVAILAQLVAAGMTPKAAAPLARTLATCGSARFGPFRVIGPIPAAGVRPVVDAPVGGRL